MKHKKTSYPPINIGLSYMMIIFITLCLIIFAVLSLSGALKDYNQSKQYAQRTTDYYTASNTAAEYLEDISDILSSNHTQDIMIQQLQTLEGITINVSKQESYLIIEYQISIDDDEFLHVILSSEPSESQQYTILSWTQKSNAEWNSNQNLPVLGSN